MRKNHLVLVLLVCFQFTQAQKYLEEEKSGYKGGFIPELKILEDSEIFWYWAISDVMVIITKKMLPHK